MIKEIKNLLWFNGHNLKKICLNGNNLNDVLAKYLFDKGFSPNYLKKLTLIDISNNSISE